MSKTLPISRLAACYGASETAMRELAKSGCDVNNPLAVYSQLSDGPRCRALQDRLSRASERAAIQERIKLEMAR